MLNCNTGASDGQVHDINAVVQCGHGKRKVHILCETEMGHWSCVTFASVKKKLNRAMNNDQITSNALPAACVKRNEIKRAESWKICAMQILLN